jgi:precorrin-3B C17-methyltransferase
VSGRLTVVGLGPGPEAWVTPAVSAVLAAAEELFGYGPYLDRLPVRPGQVRHATDNKEEISRSNSALTAAAAGRSVAVVSGGDPGVFAMAAAVCEAIDNGPPGWRALDVTFEPGVTAMLAAAARVGAPLGADFAVVSLSDNLKPWALIERRLRLASEADFALALYNPASRARGGGAERAFGVLKACRAEDTPVVLASAVGRPDENIAIARLGDCDGAGADMRTLIIVGSSGTRLIARPGRSPLVYTERFVRVS